jgi:uncharacterized protein YkwD
MTRVRTAVLIAVAACAFALPSAAAASPATTMVAKINQIRHQHGLPSVHESGSLMHSAGAYAHQMMSSGYYGHASRIHASRQFRTLGEIIDLRTGGGSPAVGQTVSDWMNSSEHRTIILMSAFKFAGAGYVTGNFHGRRSTIWVMHFGRH